ncbi:unnamed protein product [Clonostachys byssicola]|uniref:Glycosyl transferase CAP10 domain-containing protein n=1 Tax=Clonostachys byssicola TaxID=160290 RepID=A0A9N9U7C0_9HYPO|nr:unnamed protein product [Clonostachys byssicola]
MAYLRSPPLFVLKCVGVFFILLFLAANVALWHDTQYWNVPSVHHPAGAPTHNHPIRKLMLDARKRHEETLLKRSTDLNTAARRYRERRGRHPPPGFDRWFQAAMETDAIHVEDYFDRIYKDLAPYWALEPEVLKRRASSWHFVVRVRGGTATMKGDVGDRVLWLELWNTLVEEFAEHLPDVDMPINYMDESRILVPFNNITTLVDKEKKERKMVDVKEVTTEFKGLKEIDETSSETYEPEWHGPDEQYWDVAVKTCGPNTPAHGVKQVADLSQPSEFPQNYRPSYAYKGFIQNWTAAIDPCLQPHLRQLHGSLIEPVSIRSTEELIPLFGGSKLPMNNEILIPGAMYLTDREFYSGGESHGPTWVRKKTQLVWRGMGSGGRTKPHSWHHFQRHRLIDMLNSTSVSRAEAEGRAMTFELPSHEIYPDYRIKDGQLSEWLKTFADAGFGLLCPYDECDWLGTYFKVVKSIPMKKQYQYKFLPDVDGNSFSARFRGFLRSTSVPLKASIYTEWHDDRLVPWLHFIPLDNTLQDLFPALDFFADGDGPGDMAARFIAESGKDWAEATLRREDMRLVCDENRHNLGFVDDIK